ncbi:MAG: calcium-binding protein [Rhodobacteraceae bacterium]|nr:calcium-binding protein [Paracoccaceae bacterium]
MANVILTSQATTFTGTSGDRYYLPQGEIISSTNGDAFTDSFVDSPGMRLINDGTFITLGDDGVQIADNNSKITNGLSGIIRGVDAGVASFGDSITTDNFGEISGSDSGFEFANSSTNNVLANFGLISGANHGIFMQSGNGHNVVNGGTVTGGTGLLVVSSISTDVALNNSGTLSGTSGSGILVTAIGSRFEINNTGEISGIGSAISHQATVGGGTALDIVNAGQIVGHISGGLAEVNLTNTGSVFGDVNTGGSADTVINSGLISGDVDLGGGGDTFKLKEGGQVLGDVVGGAGNDQLTGNSGDNDMSGGNNNDVLRGKAGEDTLNGDNGDDELRGGKDEDTLDGGVGTDDLYGGSGDDSLSGGENVDNLYGGKGDDNLSGDGGGDNLDGGRGDDTLTGGGGADTFIFGLKSDNDVITDFTDGTDQIDLSAYNLGGRGDLVAAGAFTDTALGAVIDLSLVGGTGTITVTGMLVADLNNSEFVF